MRNECNIIRDLLPLYIERMVSADTAEFVEEHLKDCELCRKEQSASVNTGNSWRYAPAKAKSENEN